MNTGIRVPAMLLTLFGGEVYSTPIRMNIHVFVLILALSFCIELVESMSMTK